jgi:hypothetical protein
LEAAAKVTAATNDKRKTYIVHMAKSATPAEYADHAEWYGASLRSVSSSSPISASASAAKMLYAYKTVSIPRLRLRHQDVVNPEA